MTSYGYDAHGRISQVTDPPRAVYNQETGQTEVLQEVRNFTPSDTGYALINQSETGTPDQPATSVPKSAELLDSVSYGRGSRSGHTDKWGYWLDETDGLGRTTSYERDSAGRVTRLIYPDGDCVVYSYDSVGNVLSEIRAECSDLTDITLISLHKQGQKGFCS